MTKNDHLRISESNARFSVRYGKIERPIMSWPQECVEAAREIGRVAKGDVALLCSGGYESEIMARSFQAAKVKFRVFSIRFNNGLNQHDLAKMKVWKNGLPSRHSMVDFDLKNFFHGGAALDLALQTKCHSAELLSTLQVYLNLAQLGYYPVVGLNERHLFLRDGHWFAYDLQPLMSFFRALKIFNLSGCGGFWVWSPEQMLSWYKLPVLFEKFVAAEKPVAVMTRHHKDLIYRSVFDLTKRDKFTGFERAESVLETSRRQIRRKLSGWNQIYEIPFGKCVGNLSGIRN